MSLYRQDANQVVVCSSHVNDTLKILIAADAHLGMLDGRDASRIEHSARMSHHSRNTSEILAAAVAGATPDRCDFVLLLGDILSYPSAAAVDAIREVMESCAVPWRFVAGNHDRHFKGMTEPSAALRREWSARRLRPLFPDGIDPLMFTVRLKGVNLVFLDNSIYELTSEECKFARSEFARKEPAILFVHIPPYVHGQSVAFGCGHPDWGAATDRYRQIR